MQNKYRTEHDTMGEVRVPADRYWGAQTQRSYENFRIGDRKMPDEIIEAFAVLKKAAAVTNAELEVLDTERAELIMRVCDEILAGDLSDNFPLVVYQTGSGTQSNMNVNEVIAGRGNELHDKANDTVRSNGAEIAGGSEIDNQKIEGAKNLKRPFLHPNDHVNKSQSSNDTFPTAMHIAALTAIEKRVIPAAAALRETLKKLEEENKDIVKVGRTHLQDATPLTLGQEISGWRSMLDHDIEMTDQAKKGLTELALGGTAVGTGLNAPDGFAERVAEKIAEEIGLPFVTAENKFHALSSKDAICFAHGALKALSADLLKIANDVRMLASGPRCGIGEITIPENEPGSSIMPGKVNPTQCEALTMVCARVFGNDVTIGFAASQGNYQLNVYMPVMADAFLESCNILADGMISFEKNCVRGIRPNRERISENLDNTLMLVTALNTHIGYEKAAEIAKKAHRENTTLKEAALTLGYLTEEEFDDWVDPAKMI